MLRVEIRDSAETLTLRLEGRFAGDARREDALARSQDVDQSPQRNGHCSARRQPGRRTRALPVMTSSPASVQPRSV